MYHTSTTLFFQQATTNGEGSTGTIICSAHGHCIFSWEAHRGPTIAFTTYTNNCSNKALKGYFGKVKDTTPAVGILIQTFTSLSGTFLHNLACGNKQQRHGPLPRDCNTRKTGVPSLVIGRELNAVRLFAVHNPATSVYSLILSKLKMLISTGLKTY